MDVAPAIWEWRQSVLGWAIQGRQNWVLDRVSKSVESEDTASDVMGGGHWSGEVGKRVTE